MLNDAPLHDLPTSWSTQWNERLWARLSQVDRHDLLDADAVRDKWEKAIGDFDPDLVVHYGHGSETALIGDDLQPIVDEHNCKKLSGREVFTMCCSAAEKLGPTAYRKGCKVWWGYDRPFAFIVQDEEVYSRLANMGLIIRVEQGCEWVTVLGMVKTAYDKEVARLQQEEGANPWTIITLINNKTCLTLICDENQPDTDCQLRRLSVHLFGTAGQRLSRTLALSLSSLFVFWGITLHAVANELWYKGGWREVASIQGEYIGLAGIMVSILLCFREHLCWLGKK